MDSLHPTQKELLKLLENNIDDPLTIRELQEALDISSPSVVHYHIQQLEKRGFLKRNSNNPKDYQLLKKPDKPIVYLNAYGLAQCGSNGSILDGNPVDRIPIASRLLKFPAEEGFIVIAKGDSMEPYIKAGDIVIAQKRNDAQNGDIIICVNNSEALIKKFSSEGTNIKLISINEKYSPFLASDDFRIEGVLRNVIKYN